MLGPFLPMVRVGMVRSCDLTRPRATVRVDMADAHGITGPLVNFEMELVGKTSPRGHIKRTMLRRR